MSDLFYEEISDAYIAAVADVMIQAHRHTCQVLRKRSTRMGDLLRSRLRFAAGQKHIWWGVGVENKACGIPRIDHLRAASAAVRFLFIKPLVEDLRQFNLLEIHWVIGGGESGSGAGPMKRSWVVAIRKQCRDSSVPFFSNSGAVSGRPKRDGCSTGGRMMRRASRVQRKNHIATL